MVAENIMHMNIGDGETSYAKNSALQRLVISKTLPVLEEALEEMLADPRLGSQKCYKLVDLGCSSGPNSLCAMAHIINTIENICRKKNVDDIPEFEVYLNDLPDNDFNNLFKLVSDFHRDRDEEGERRCFVSCLPGSFYGRLFTKKSLHFAYSSYSVHWLSQVTQGLDSVNKENIYLAEESSPKVLEAYSKQFQRDFSTFLRSRAEELIQGGRMVLSFLGRSLESPYDDGAYFTLLAKSLLDMVTEGRVNQEDLYSFNIPHYSPCKSEVHAIVKNEGSFTLDKIQDFRVPWNVNDDGERDDHIIDSWSGKLVAHCVRAIMETMMTKHFGSLIIDDLFERYTKRARDHMSTNKPTYYNIVISLVRK